MALVSLLYVNQAISALEQELIGSLTKKSVQMDSTALLALRFLSHVTDQHSVRLTQITVNLELTCRSRVACPALQATFVIVLQDRNTLLIQSRMAAISALSEAIVLQERLRRRSRAVRLEPIECLIKAPVSKTVQLAQRIASKPERIRQIVRNVAVERSRLQTEQNVSVQVHSDSGLNLPTLVSAKLDTSSQREQMNPRRRHTTWIAVH